MVSSFDRAALIGGGEATPPETVKVRQHHAMDFGFLEALSKNFERVSELVGRNCAVISFTAS